MEDSIMFTGIAITTALIIAVIVFRAQRVKIQSQHDVYYNNVFGALLNENEL